jgi:uncharacterized membrane protein YfcA
LIGLWFGAAAVGLSLGLLGSGGAILTVPILVYVVGHGEKSAIVESFVIVGAIALLGMLRALRANQVDVRSAVLLALPGIIGTSIGTRVSASVPGALQLVLLVPLMCVAAFLMFREGATTTQRKLVDRSSTGKGGGPLWIILLEGAALGFLTGLLGVGGGFLIVPMLVLVRGLPMHRAVGTSLAVITINSASAFLHFVIVRGTVPAGTDSTPRVAEAITIDWQAVGIFASIGCIAIILGNALGDRIPTRALRRVFAVLLVLLAIFTLIRSLPHI